jgi:hypothetical protein
VHSSFFMGWPLDLPQPLGLGDILTAIAGFKLLAIRWSRDTSASGLPHRGRRCRAQTMLRGRPHRSRSCVRQWPRPTALLLRRGQVNTTGVRTAACFPLDQRCHQAAEYRDGAIKCQRHHRSSSGLIKDLLLCLDHRLVFQERLPECLELAFDQSRVGEPPLLAAGVVVNRFACGYRGNGLRGTSARSVSAATCYMIGRITWRSGGSLTGGVWPSAIYSSVRIRH